VEAIKGILKILIVSIVAYNVVSNHLDEYIYLATKSVTEIIAFAVSVIFELGLKIGIALFVMAVADFAYQKYEHEKSLKMSKQEVKDEVKQQEGDGKIKNKIRSKQFEMSAQRMMMGVPEASVVITNPVFIAIALKYDPQSNSDAPKVIAKGKRKIAAKIKEIAMENDVPVIENKPLARSMYDACQIGMEIPYDFYQAVAEILADIINSKNKKRVAI
jgi:flagellar biosynthetic protein FlhB